MVDPVVLDPPAGQELFALDTGDVSVIELPLHTDIEHPHATSAGNDREDPTPTVQFPTEPPPGPI